MECKIISLASTLKMNWVECWTDIPINPSSGRTSNIFSIRPKKLSKSLGLTGHKYLEHLENVWQGLVDSYNSLIMGLESREETGTPAKP